MNVVGLRTRLVEQKTGKEEKKHSLPDFVFHFPSARRTTVSIYIYTFITCTHVRPNPSFENRHRVCVYTYDIINKYICIKFRQKLPLNGGDCRLSSVDRVIYKALARPPQVITSAGPELGFLPTQRHTRPELPGFRSSDPFY